MNRNTYFDSYWIPLACFLFVVFLSMLCLVFFSNYGLSLTILLVGVLSLLGMSSASLWNFIKGRWLKGGLNLLFLLVIIFLFYSMFFGTPRSCKIPYPGNPSGITFIQRLDRSGLGGSDEFKLKVRFGGWLNSVDRFLPDSYAYPSLMNAYWYPEGMGDGPCLRFEGGRPDIEYLIGLKEQKTYQIIRHADHVFVFELDEKEFQNIAKSLPSEEAQVYIGSKRVAAADITSTPVGQGPGEYLGRIDGRWKKDAVRFVPVSESPEMQIPKQRSSPFTLD